MSEELEISDMVFHWLFEPPIDLQNRATYSGTETVDRGGTRTTRTWRDGKVIGETVVKLKT